jgi:uncharacterized RDD family membrane protein YckC
MKCPHCQREQPMSFKCRFCGGALVRQSAPPRSASTPPAPRPSASSMPASRTATAPAVNPYAAPVAASEAYALADGMADDAPLAGRWARFCAAFLNGLLNIGAMLPGIFVIALAAGAGRDSSLPAVLLPIGILVMLVCLIALLIYQVRMLARDGQTWGKKRMNIRVVLYDTGTVPGLGRSFGLREVVNNLLANIPFIGGFYALADCLFIFGEERRCVHDLIAGTKVVEVAPSSSFLS